MSALETLAESGVYLFLGCEIPNYIDHGLDGDKVYQVLKDEHFILSIGCQARNNKTPVYLSRFNSDNEPVGYLDGVVIYLNKVTSNMTVKDRSVFDEITNKELYNYACCYQTDIEQGGGYFNGVHYDILLKNPKLEAVCLVEKVKQPIK